MKIAAILSMVAIALAATTCEADTLKYRKHSLHLQKSSKTHSNGMTLTPDHDERVRRGFRLIETSDWIKWLPKEEVAKMIAAPQHNFMDITDQQEIKLRDGLLPEPLVDIPKEPRLKDTVKPIFEALSTQRMRANLERFTEFHTRYYKSETGVDSANWLLEKIRSIAKTRSDITVEKFEHGKWDQFSIIARFNPAAEEEGEGIPAVQRGSGQVDLANALGTVIVSAHQDSVAGFIFQKKTRSPGADDDGSGTMTILEAFSALIEHDFKPDVPLEFHWYSAEEAGLLGSQDVATSYVNAGRPVLAMVQMDMTGYTGKQNVIGLVNDFTTPALTEFNRKLIDTYLDTPYSETKCGYACSDHASWYKAGYPAAFTIESDFDKSNPFIHSKKDTVENIDFDHMKEFAKLAVGFAVEISSVSNHRG